MQFLFRPGYNCWRREYASHLSVIVDYGNYYRDLHESIVKAKKSIFILGWDIDSRIELLRGKDAAQAKAPAAFFDLICWKARQNPDMQFYFNKWDYSFLFMKQREPFWQQKWEECDLPNVHHCLDDVLPLGACHHQKIAVIDDEVAYWGGMDVALGRWDFRQHHVDNRLRADPGQLPYPGRREYFGPYHDIQAVMAGPAATALAELVRERWRIACRHIEPVPLRVPDEGRLPATWPDSDPPDFTDVEVAISRTLPAEKGRRNVEEIYRLYIDEIAAANQFIYIENQFLTNREVARALNRRLHEKPELRVLAVSCENPKGIMERKAMWGGRVIFRDILEEGGVGGRVALAYPVTQENGKVSSVRIHSKLMIVDDRLLHIGSANLNNRSMGMDSECDVTVIGEDEAACRKIASIRNDLIREHTGYAAEYIEQVVSRNESVQQLLVSNPASRQHLYPVDDEPYRGGRVTNFIIKAADPVRSWIPARFTRFPRRLRAGALKARTVWILAALLALVAGVSLLWSHTSMSQYADIDRISELMKRTQDSPAAVAGVLAAYIVGGLVFFPVTVLTVATILVFGGVKGFTLAYVGSLASSVIGYMVGHRIGKGKIERFFPKSRKIIQKIQGGGIISVVAIRTLPIAPFTLINMLFGVVAVPIWSFVIGTALGLLPGKVMMAMFGSTLTDVLRNPQMEQIMQASFLLIAWLLVVLTCNKLARNWQAAHRKA